MSRENQSIIAFLQAWWTSGKSKMATGDLLNLATFHGLEITGKDEHGRRSSLGQWLGRRRGLWIEAASCRYRISDGGVCCGYQRWRIEREVTKAH